ncbi:MAG: intein-containing adenosylcobalamin-dependent ribonucleoside-diphosphate reductase [Planctomycetes bacterium]|nr:intein-containing adenosylcobalamin-dependent ribonucleoside-diphosphate reductase [Planctomycetota bacterium]
MSSVPATKHRDTDQAVRFSAEGLRIKPVFCPAGVKDPFETTDWERRTASIAGEGGEMLFEQRDVEIPTSWSQLATNIVVSKYFYGEIGTPEREQSVRQLIHRVTRTIADWGTSDGYFASAEDGERFYRELTWLCLHQHGAFNSPVWFNVGLYQEYGVKGAQCNWHWDVESEEATQPENSYEFPQGSACFIQRVDDNMESIMELARSEAMLFKFGSGTGTDLSTIRSHREKLSGGGRPSGPLSFMRVYDQIAAVVKSGGKTRRAAKMQSIKIWHPDVMEFIECKAKEEAKALCLIRSGEYEANFNGEAYSSIMFQNANLSIRITDEFMRAVERDEKWETHWVTDKNKAGPEYEARDLLAKMAENAWKCGDPGVQYDTTINRWHTCPESGRINASNPCVTGDTLVSTDEGLRRIDSMVGETPQVTGLDGNLHQTTRVIPTGVKPVYRLRTKSGYEVKLTADHLVWTANRGDVPAAELTRDDVVRLVPGEFGEEEVEVDVAEYVGLMLGDGCISAGIATLTMNKEMEFGIAEKAARVVNRFDRQRGEVHVTERSATSCVATCASSVVDLLESYAVLDEGSSKKQLTDRALGLSRKSIAALLRGLYTADGTVADYGEKSQFVSLDSTSEQLLQQVQVLLLGFGIKSKMYRNRRLTDRAMLPDGQGGYKQYPVRQMHSLRISRSSRIRFEREIGFMPESYKAEALQQLNERVGTYRDKLIDPVVSLELLGEEPVYDLTEPVTEHFVANGMAVHNCSEYMFLDDTACNLASINLMKFQLADGGFDVKRYQAAARIFFIAQEILVDHASYPTKTIAENSHAFRPLGLGYSNLGSLIMTNGLAYDSAGGRGLCGAMTALMHGVANLTSAEMAAVVGPFDRFEENRRPMLRVMRMHRDAVGQIDPSCPEYLVEAARDLWDDVVEAGKRYGYRNAQATVLAPTGTISFMMDCDTTGIEPDIALVKYKQLAGRGMLKIVNNTVPLSLKNVGYDQPKIESITAYINEHDTIEGAEDLKPADLPIFDCAFKPKNGKRSIAWRAHVQMMAAAQPFLSGAISKTVNMPNDVKPDDIAAAYTEGWRLGLKALAVYRDGSKGSQPLSTAAEGDQAGVKKQDGPRRDRLPDTRNSITHKFSVAGHEGYITAGMYDDGRPGELFITMAKEGSTIGGLMDSFGTAISISLQYGVPLAELVNKFSHSRFEPMGHTKNPDIRIAKSLVDYIFRWLGITFIPGYREANLGMPAAKEAEEDEAEKPAAKSEQVATDVGGQSAGFVASSPATFVAPSINGNGHSNGHSGTAIIDAIQLQTAGVRMTDQQQQFASFQTDAPPCDVCGAITVRNGNCYLCYSCGNSMGCS